MAMQPTAHSLSPYSLHPTTTINGNNTPAKRPALADVNSGLPIFDSLQPVVTSAGSNHAGLYAFQSPCVTNGSNSIMGVDEMGEGSKEGDDVRQQQIQPQLQMQPQFYPDTCALSLSYANADCSV